MAAFLRQGEDILQELLLETWPCRLTWQCAQRHWLLTREDMTKTLLLQAGTKFIFGWDHRTL